MTVDFQIRTELRDLFEHTTINVGPRQVCTRACNSFSQLLLVGVIGFTERVSIAIVTFTTLNNVDSILQVVFGDDFGVQTEPIE
jgi:hypothetical protein